MPSAGRKFSFGSSAPVHLVGIGGAFADAAAGRRAAALRSQASAIMSSRRPCTHGSSRPGELVGSKPRTCTCPRPYEAEAPYASATRLPPEKPTRLPRSEGVGPVPPPGTNGVVRTGVNQPMGVAPPPVGAVGGAGPQGIVGGGGDGAGIGGGPLPRTAPGRVIMTGGAAVGLIAPPTSVVRAPARRSSGRVGKTASVPPASSHPTSASSCGPWSRASRSEGITTTVAAAYPDGALREHRLARGRVDGGRAHREGESSTPGAVYGDVAACHPDTTGQPRMTTESLDGSSTSTSSGAEDSPSDRVVSASFEPSSAIADSVTGVPE